MARIDWPSAAQGERVIPILLIHGVPGIFCLEGADALVTGFSLTSPDSAWWPGTTYSNWTTYVKPWLSLRGDGLRIAETAHPGQATLLDVSEVTVFMSDVEGAATELFESRDALTVTAITATLSATGTTLNVQSTGAFPSSGTLFLEQETILYSGVTSTTFTGLTRGAFGSKAARHLYSTSVLGGYSTPRVYDGPLEIIGRPATLWLGRLSAAGVLTAVNLEFFGVVGTGAVLAGGGESLDEGYVITLDHALKRLAQTIRATGVRVAGFAHPGLGGIRTTRIPPPATTLTPVWAIMQNTSTGTTTGVVALTDDPTTIDASGWHDSPESFVRALGSACSGTFTGGTVTASLVDGALTFRFAGFAAGQRLMVQSPCCAQQGAPVEGQSGTLSMGAISKAWVPITTASQVYLSASDYSAIPPRPTLDASAGATHSSANFMLIFGDDRDPASRRLARIDDQAQGAGVQLVVVTAIGTDRVRLVGFLNPYSTPTTQGRTGPYASGFVISEPSVARLGLYVESDHWVTALQYMCQALDTEYTSIYDAVDWDHMLEVAQAYPGALPASRKMVVDLKTTLLSVLQNEAGLNGFTLIMRHGRVSIARVAEFATTEVTSATLSTGDLLAASPSPHFERGSDGIVNSYSVRDPESGMVVNYIDATSQAAFGTRGVIEVTRPRGLPGVGGPSAPVGATYAALTAQAIQVIGPLRYPYATVTVTVGLNQALGVGDLATVTELRRVPNGLGGRGLESVIAQVVARDLTMYGDGGRGHITLTFRLNPRSLSGYAPTVLVAAAGITGATVTADTTTLGAGGPAGSRYSDGGASTFAVGDLVRLVEIDSTSPTASTQHTVTAIAGAVITLSPAPSATFATLAASALKVMLVYDDWSVVAGAMRQDQMKYAFLGLDGSLDVLTRSRVYAA